MSISGGMVNAQHKNTKHEIKAHGAFLSVIIC